jgi:biopolymer transport protein ExbD
MPQRKKMRFKRNSREEDYSIQLIPLIDVVFFLLAFFMISTTFVDINRNLDIDLPEAKAGAASEKSMVFEVEIGVDGKIRLNGEDVTLVTLETMLKQRIPGMTAGKRSVVIRADTKANHGEVVKVMDICKRSGVTQIGVAVR